MNRMSVTDADQMALTQVSEGLKGLAPGTVVFVDFDETLWLRNSTEAYLRALRPRLVAVVLLMLLDHLRPWRLLPGTRPEHVYRDWLRVLLSTLLMPWNILRWRRLARTLGPRYLNQPLLQSMRDAGVRPLVASFGFRFLVAPLLRAMDPKLELVLAAGLWRGYRLRRGGKRAALARLLGDAALADAACITDNAQDSDLLDAVDRPLLIRWARARFQDALADAYVPFLYTQRGKRTGENYLWAVVLKRDVLVLWLAFAWVQPNPLAAAGALLLLHLSFWLVYEIGYHENDQVGDRLEAKPALAAGYHEMRGRMDAVSAWIAALAFAVPGVLLLGWAQGAPPLADNALAAGPGHLALLLLGWTLYLVAARLTFHVYNYRATVSRGLLYLPLQLFRSLGYGLFFMLTLPGAALCIASILISWVPYLSYRYAGCRMQSPDRLLFLVLFLLLLVAMGLAVPQVLLSWQTAAILAYLGWRARNEAAAWLASARPLTAPRR